MNELEINNFIIRPMILQDLKQVYALDKLSFPHPWPQGAYEFEIQKSTASRSWVLEFNKQDQETLIAGLIVVYIIIDEAQIATFAIHPDFQNKGFGRKLLRYALKQCQQEKVNLVFLEVRRSNLPAQSLYQAFGFETVNIRKDYYSNNEDALLMNLDHLQQKAL
ncbi:MAG: ribosomal protein S18-alanine N-acetyltransferase [Anaerolineaceae bacterium]|nr:ribosomal protein S18-alanine N-acetyltransferase [Anaerolineaceae bacterium]